MLLLSKAAKVSICSLHCWVSFSGFAETYFQYCVESGALTWMTGYTTKHSKGNIYIPTYLLLLHIMQAIIHEACDNQACQILEAAGLDPEGGGHRGGFPPN